MAKQIYWTQDELTILKNNYLKMPNKDLCNLINRSKQGIQRQAFRMGLAVKLVATYKFCIDCGTKLSRAAIYRPTVKRCRPCETSRHQGKNHHNWQGGVCALRSMVHCLLKHPWIDAIFKRDNYTCQNCGNRGGDKHAHHTNPYPNIRKKVLEEHKELNLSKFRDKRKAAILIAKAHKLTDGITLCLDCHAIAHNAPSLTKRESRGNKPH